MSTAALLGRDRLDDADWLRAQYVERAVSLRDLSHVCGCRIAAVRHALEASGIAIRPRGKQPTEIAGQSFGELTVIGRNCSHRAQERQAFWDCRCSCGGSTVTDSYSLISGRTTSCGCRYRTAIGERSRRHGNAPKDGNSPTYTSWLALRHNAKREGIEVCDQWNGFECFLAEMGQRPNGKVLMRINLDKGFVPGNCLWASPGMRNRNVVRAAEQIAAAASRLGVFSAGDICAETGFSGQTVRRHLGRLVSSGKLRILSSPSRPGRGYRWEYISPAAAEPTSKVQVPKRRRDFSGGGRSGASDLPADKDMRDLARRAIAAGAKIQRSGSDHFRVTLPNGKTTTLSNTPSDHRAVVNARGDLKRLGLGIG